MLTLALIALSSQPGGRKKLTLLVQYVHSKAIISLVQPLQSPVSSRQLLQSPVLVVATPFQN